MFVVNCNKFEIELERNETNWNEKNCILSPQTPARYILTNKDKKLNYINHIRQELLEII